MRTLATVPSADLVHTGCSMHGICELSQLYPQQIVCEPSQQKVSCSMFPPSSVASATKLQLAAGARGRLLAARAGEPPLAAAPAVVPAIAPALPLAGADMLLFACIRPCTLYCLSLSRLSIHRSSNLYIHLSIDLSVYRSIYRSIYPCTYPSIYRSIYRAIHRSFYSPNYRSIY